MPNARQTQVLAAPRQTAAATRGTIDPSYTLYGAVKAFNQRQAGRAYEQGAAEALYDAVKAFNTRRLGR